MKERPILFSGALVRALLAGTKTQTRRPIKPQPNAGPRAEMVNLGYRSWGLFDGDLSGEWRCPYGVPGERLWVKETFGFTGRIPTSIHRESIRNRFVANPAWFGYRADHPEGGYCWYPSIHMPHAFSRLTLEITDIRVQRLQEISEDDAKAEGVDGYVGGEGFVSRDALNVEPGYWHPHFYRQGFRAKWEDIYGDTSWDANPWVWAITFEVLK